MSFFVPSVPLLAVVSALFRKICAFLLRARVLMAFVGEVLCAIGLTTEWLALSSHTDVF